MNNQQKAVSHLLALALVNTGVIGLGLAIYQNRPLALIAGLIAEKQRSKIMTGIWIYLLGIAIAGFLVYRYAPN